MTRDDLRARLEPLTIQFKQNGVIPEDALVEITTDWLEKSGYVHMTECFDVWNEVMAELVIKHGIAARRLN